MKPWIGITTYEMSQGAGNRYGSLPLRVAESAFEKAIWQTGGIPVLLPQVSSRQEAGELCERLDGILIIGGHDVDPTHYGEAPHIKLGELDIARDQSDLAYIEAAEEIYLPILGVCRGMQLLNVAFGGSLYQDLSENETWKIQHDQKTAVSEPFHEINVERESILYDLLGTEHTKVNTVHHQAIKDLSPQFKITATSPDQIIEAVESTGDHPMIGVQWHPELLFEKSKGQLAIFEWLIQASKSCDCCC